MSYSRSLKFCRNGASFRVFIFPFDEPSEGLGQPVNELIFGLRVKTGKPLGLHNEPEPFDGVEIRRVRRQKDRLKLSPIQ